MVPAIQEKSFVWIEMELAYAEGHNLFVDGLIMIEHDRMNCIEGGMIEVRAARAPEQLTVTVSDSGAGIPADFDLESSTSLGLQIVRTLVVGELGGQLSITPRAGGGTVAVVDLPIRYEPLPRQGPL